MSDYIKREDVLALIDKGYLISNSNYSKEIELINKVPTADVVEVVRCKECAKRHDGYHCPMQVWCGTADDDYCSRGEREVEQDDYIRRLQKLP